MGNTVAGAPSERTGPAPDGADVDVDLEPGGHDGPAFDLDRAWEIDPLVSLRPESFGALAYHYGTRRLSFLKSRELLAVVSTLGARASAREACRSAGVPDEQLPHYTRALAALADSGMIAQRCAP